MSVEYLDSINLTGTEVLNARFQNLASDPGSPGLAQFWFNTTWDHLRVKVAASIKTVPFIASSGLAALTVGGAASMGSGLDTAPVDHVHAMPGLATGSADGFLSTAFWNRLNNATAVATASTLIIRDSNARAQVADPAAGQDIATYAWVLGQIALAKQGLAWKNPVRSIFTGALPASSYVAGTKRLTASANGVLPTNDGVGSWAIGDRVALGGQATGSQNGLYVIIDPGTAGTPWILERTSDFGGPGFVAGDVYAGAFFVVREGTEYGDTTWVCSNDTVTIDTTAINFQVQTSASVDNSTIGVNSSGNLWVLDGGITFAKLQTLPACSIIGRAANASGVSAAISAGADNTVLTRTSGSLGFTAVSNAMLATMAARSVKVNATNATAVPTDLAAGAGDRVLQSNAVNTALEWGQVRTAGIADDAITYPKMQNVSAQYRVWGRITTGAGDVEELTPANLRALLISDITADRLAVKQFTIGNGTDTTITITHNFGTQNIISVTFKRIADQKMVSMGWTCPTVNTVVCTVGGAAPGAASIVASIMYVPN